MRRHQPAQLTRKQESFVLRKMMQHARSLPTGTPVTEVRDALRSLKVQWIREAVEGQPDAR